MNYYGKVIGDFLDDPRPTFKSQVLPGLGRLLSDHPNLERNSLKGQEHKEDGGEFCLFLSCRHTLSCHPSVLKVKSRLPARPRRAAGGTDGMKGGSEEWVHDAPKPNTFCSPLHDRVGGRGWQSGWKEKRRGRSGRSDGKFWEIFFSCWHSPGSYTRTMCVCALEFGFVGTRKVTSLHVLSLGRDYCLLPGRVASSQPYYCRCLDRPSALCLYKFNKHRACRRNHLRAPQLKSRALSLSSLSSWRFKEEARKMHCFFHPTFNLFHALNTLKKLPK